MTHVWLLIFLIFLIKSKAQGFGINRIKLPDDDRGQISCTAALLGKYFHSGESLSGFVLHMSISSAAAHVQQSLLQYLHKDEKYPWTIVVKEVRRDYDAVTAQLIMHEKPQCYFIIIENMEDEDMDELFENWKSNLNWNPLAQFVVYLSAVEETEEEMTEIMIEILLNFMNKKIYNVNVIGQSEETTYYYGKTVFPYHPDNNCGNRVISVKTLDICEYQEGAEEEVGDGEEEPGDEGDEEEQQDQEVTKVKEKVKIEVEEDENEKENEETTAIDIKVCQEQLSNNCKADNKSTNSSEMEHTYQTPTTVSYIHVQNAYETSVISSPSDAEYINGSIEAIMDYKSRPITLTQSKNQSIYPKLYIAELYRALFLDKFPKDLSGCPLVAAYRPWEPYIFNEAFENSENVDIPADDTEVNPGQTNYTSYAGRNNYDDSDDYVYGESEADVPTATEEVRLNGIEYQMIQTIGERLHLSIEMHVENRNLFHLFQQLIDGDIEMVVGGIDEDPSISQFVSSTIPYHQDDLTWCVAKAQETYNLFSFLETFESGAWILTLVFILTASLNILVSKKLLKLRIDLMKSYFSINIYVMGVILSQSLNLKSIPTCLKVSFGSTFIMGLMFSNVYQSFLVSTLTTPKSSYQISHLQEIYQNRMHIMGSVDNVRHLNKEGEIYRYVREQFQMCYNIEECLKRTATDAKIAVAVSRHHSFYNPRIPRDRLYCFDRNENIYVYLVTMLMPKTFHLLHKINPVIQHIIESGHMQKWARDIDMRRKISEEIQRAREEPFKSLTLSQSCGGFVFAGILLLFSLCVFAFEHLIYWLVVERKTRLKLAKKLHSKFA